MDPLMATEARGRQRDQFIGAGSKGGSDTDRGNGARNPHPPIIALVLPDHQTGRVISAFAPFLLRGRRLYCLDGGNVFNPYRLAVWARREGLDPQLLLERVFISRAYTCHQLLGAAETMLAPLIDGPEPPLVAFLGVDRLFHDEDLPQWERRYLFERLLDCTDRLHARGLPILITVTDAEPNPWARRLSRVALILPDVGRALGRIADEGQRRGQKPEKGAVHPIAL